MTRPIEQIHLALSAGSIAAAAAFASPAFTVALAIGAAIEALNFRGLVISSRAFFEGLVRGSGGWIGLFALRLGVLATLIVLALRLGADPVGLVIGLSLILPAAIAGAFRVRPLLSTDPAPPTVLDPDDDGWDRWDPWLARERAANPEGGDD